MPTTARKHLLLTCVGLVLVVPSAPAQSTQPQINPKVVFQRVRVRLVDDSSRMPRYTCVQTITRRFYLSDLKNPPSCSLVLSKRGDRKRALPLATLDRVQLEVAVAEHREVHSWPGSSTFADEDEIRKVIGNGAFGTGDFAAFIASIFGDAARVTFEGERVVDGKTLLAYSFQMPWNASRYHVDSKSGPVVTAYGGSFWLDPQAEDLVHLSVRTAELPKGTESCQAINDMEYGRTDIHGSSVLIPRETDLRVIYRSGEEAATVTSYSNCRKFASKVVLRFDDPDPRAKTPIQTEETPRKSPATPFPAGIKFDCRIVTPIDSDTPAGLPIEAVLRSPIRDKNNTILAPQGARIQGRLVRLAQHYSTYDYFEVAVRLESVEVNGVQRPIYATLVDQPLGPASPLVTYSGFPEVMVSPTSFLPNTGEFFLVNEHLRMRGLDSKWMTASPAAKPGPKPEPKPEPKEENQPTPRQLIAEGASAAAAVAPQITAPAGPASQTFPSPAIAAPPQANSAQPAPPRAQDSAEFRLKVESNLVVVRAVARDAHGKPIETLGREDFRLFDKGKEQTIAHFEIERSPQPSTSPLDTAEAVSTAKVLSSGAPSFLAFYVDDLNTSDTDMIEARDAADRYFAGGLRANERVAIFTSDEAPLDFTADPKQIHEALAKLHTSPRALARLHDCPELTDYQAQQITQFPDDTTIDAWKAALDEVAARCPQPNPPSNNATASSAAAKQLPSSSNAKYLIQMAARQVLDQAEIQARSNLDQLERLLNYLSRLPGQRTIVLVSPGFLSESDQAQVDRIIDHALKSQVVVSSLDPKGLALLMREADVTRSYTPSANSGVIGASHNVDTMRELAATDVLAQLASGTGGEFFHNNNDLKAGFDAVAGSSVSYILAFVPQELDGKFHKLEVKLTRSKASVRARRGYFAVKSGPEDPGLQLAAGNPNDDALRRVMASRDEIRELSVDINTDVAPATGDTKQLNIVVRLNLASMPFHKEGDRSVNTITFVAGIYDDNGRWVDGEQKRFDLTLPDSELNDMRTSGAGVKHTFKLKPGKYLLREVVQDSEDHHLAALNRSIEIL
jgi:VWFA-related protein